MSVLFIYNKLPITSSDLAYLHIKDKIDLKTEEIWVTCLNSNKNVIKSACIFKGSINHCHIHPREIFNFTITNRSHSFILYHSHPSDNPLPSKSDKLITKRILKAGKLLGINMVDHIIVTSINYYSFLDNNALIDK